MNIAALGYPVGFPFGNPFIRFYAIIILCGALVALLISNYRAHKDGFDMHFFDTVFPIAFLAGIVGARIWYVIATYQHEFAGRPFWDIFDIRSGGLAIQGGAIGGILVGVLYCVFRRKGGSLLRFADYAVPTILIAQAIGRWGNFFNQEVFGHFVSQDAWNFLPSFITNNMQNGDLPMGVYFWNDIKVTAASTGIVVPSGAIASPLFLVEGVINIAFYFLIAHGLPAVFGKRYRYGDSTFAYFIAYGIIRAALEPLRNPRFIMGVDGGQDGAYRSLNMAIAFVVIGVMLIALNHVLYHFASKGKFDKVPAFKRQFIDVLEVPTLHVEEKETEVPSLDQEEKHVEEQDDFMAKLKNKEEKLQEESHQEKS